MDTVVLLYTVLIILCFALSLLFSPNAVYFIHKSQFEWRKKDKPVEKKERVYYDIVYYPLSKKYAARYHNQYPFRTAEGTFVLHSRQSSFHLYSTKKGAEDFLKLFLEWEGKDVVSLSADI